MKNLKLRIVIFDRIFYFTMSCFIVLLLGIYSIKNYETIIYKYSIIISIFFIVTSILLLLMGVVHRKRNEFISKKGQYIEGIKIKSKLYSNRVFSPFSLYMKLEIEYMMRENKKYTLKTRGYHAHNVEIVQDSQCRLVLYKNKLYLDESSIQLKPRK